MRSALITISVSTYRQFGISDGASVERVYNTTSQSAYRALSGGHRRQHDNAAPGVLGNVRQQSLADKHRTSDIDVHDVVIVSQRDVLQSIVAVDAGIVDNNVDLGVLAAERLFTGASKVSADARGPNISFDNVGFGASAEFGDVVGHFAGAALTVGRHVVLSGQEGS